MLYWAVWNVNNIKVLHVQKRMKMAFDRIIDNILQNWLQKIAQFFESRM